MNMIELHILQSFPVTCLNRDDLGAPKSALFGGVSRARVSSQCWKRAIRDLANEYAPGLFAGTRTRIIIPALESCFLQKGMDGAKAKMYAIATADAIGTLDDPEKGNVKTLLYFSPQEMAAVVDAVMKLDIDPKLIAESTGEDAKKADKARKDLSKLLTKAVKSLASQVKDMADIALFGRMVADDHTLTLEGAGLFSHALSTHAVSTELDFFSAVDDTKREDSDDAGAGHIGTLEYNSACYYRYVGLNLDLLMDANHLGHFSDDEKKSVLSSFLKAAIWAVPNARKNSMFGHNPPEFILGLRREGQPLSLANAFEKPVTGGKDGYVATSEQALMAQWSKLQGLYCLTAQAEAKLPPDNLDTLIAKLIG